MSSRLWVAAGLMSGVITGFAVLALVVALGPEPGIARATVAPSPGPSAAATAASPIPGGVPSPGGSVGPGSSPSAPASATATRSLLHIGEPAPVLVVPQVGGGTIDVATLRGRPVWLVFFSASCSACVQELGLMNGYLSRYSSSGLVVLGIDVKDDEGSVTNLARRAGATFPFGLDLDGSTQREWDIQALPATFWIDQAGVIRDAATDILGAERMASGLRLILPGVDVRP